jgi:hypothetical protein
LKPCSSDPPTKDWNNLDCGPIEASGRVMDETGVGSAIICSDIGDKEICEGSH